MLLTNFFARFAFMGILLFSSSFLFAQEKFSLKEAIDFALLNQKQLKTAQFDVESSQARINELKGVALPQVSANAQYMNNIKVQSQFIPANAFDFESSLGFVVDPLIANGTINPANIPVSDPNAIQALAFGVNHMADAHLEASQLLFDGSYFVGLKAAKTYKDLLVLQSQQTERDVAINVTKAYYGALVAKERKGLLDANISRLDSLRTTTEALVKNGFVQRIDLQRLDVQLNNLKTENTKVDRLIELSYRLLNFQMGREINSPIQLSDSLSTVMVTDITPNKNVSPESRIEYRVLQSQQQLAFLDIRNYRAATLPSFAAFARGGYNVGANEFGETWRTKDYREYMVVGVSMSWKLFGGFQRHFKEKQARITYQKVGLGLDILRESFDLELAQAATQLKNALNDLETQKANMELAREVSRVAAIKYREGTGNNLEFTNAESDYKEARTNYYDAVYNAIIAQLDYQKATGEFNYGK